MKHVRGVVGGIVCAAVVAGAAAASGCREPAAPAAVADLDLERDGLDFERHDVLIGSVARQTVLTGFLLGGAMAELVVVNIDGHGDRRLRIHAFGRRDWVPKLDAVLRPGVLFVDVVGIGGHDRLITYEPGRLSWFDPESASERELVAVTSSFDPPRKDEIPHVDVGRDVNGDGLDDLVVPDHDGFWVFVQGSDGAFAAPVKLGPTTDLSRVTGADGYRYDPWSQSRIHALDYDHDGRGDLVFWNEDRFEVHLQDERGRFGPAAESFTTDVPFDSDDLSSLADGDRTGRVLHSLADMNGDGVGDLVIHSIEGRRISRKRSAYEVHLGMRTPAGGTAFATEVGITFRSKDRIQVGMDRHDFDGDGQADVMVTTIQLEILESSLWKSLKGFMGEGIGVDLEFYRQERGRYRDEPDAVHTLGLIGASTHRSPGWVPLELVLRGGKHEGKRTQEGWQRLFDPNLFIGDVDGDGRSDLLEEETFRGLDVYLGVPGPGLFARRPLDLSVIVPNDEEYAWLVDLDADGKQDILLHHPFILRDVHGSPRRRPGTEQQRVTILIAR